GYRACVSDDRETWTRADTDYDKGELIIRDTPSADLVWYSYFAPYALERVADLLAEAQRSPRARIDRLGATVEGRDLDRVVVGSPGPGKRVIWVIARQH